MGQADCPVVIRPTSNEHGASGSGYTKVMHVPALVVSLWSIILLYVLRYCHVTVTWSIAVKMHFFTYMSLYTYTVQWNHSWDLLASLQRCRTIAICKLLCVAMIYTRGGWLLCIRIQCVYGDLIALHTMHVCAYTMYICACIVLVWYGFWPYCRYTINCNSDSYCSMCGCLCPGCGICCCCWSNCINLLPLKEKMWVTYNTLNMACCILHPNFNA